MSEVCLTRMAFRSSNQKSKNLKSEIPSVVEEVEVGGEDMYSVDWHNLLTTNVSDMAYEVPAGTTIGHVHLKVADLERALTFYRDLLGFQITVRYGSGAVFLSAGGYHHHIGLNTWYSKGAGPAAERAAGLFHAAILYPTEKDLGVVLKRLLENNYPLSGASDHGVSKALYLNDPDGNGVELYWDRPKEEWPVDAQGNLVMFTEVLDVEGLLSLAP